MVGNVAFYGATSGEAFVRGVAGERFCVRNSGVNVVVEGVGDHGCEYMTGGRVVVLGRTGRNFAAGMSGGVAYVLDVDGDFARRCNKEMVDLETLVDAGEIDLVQNLIMKHVAVTGSAYAERLLADWAGAAGAPGQGDAARIQARPGAAGQGRRRWTAVPARVATVVAVGVGEPGRRRRSWVSRRASSRSSARSTRRGRSRNASLDWREVYLPYKTADLEQQGARCMDCGIPFCHQGCPLGNLIPDWNDLVYRDRWQAAIDRLHATNNFPEFTGKLCPAPCEGACVLGINEDPGHDQVDRGLDHRPRMGRRLGGAQGRRPTAR